MNIKNFFVEMLKPSYLATQPMPLIEITSVVQ